jgi:hypothetical protein
MQLLVEVLRAAGTIMIWEIVSHVRRYIEANREWNRRIERRERQERLKREAEALERDEWSETLAKRVHNYPIPIPGAWRS